MYIPLAANIQGSMLFGLMLEYIPLAADIQGEYAIFVHAACARFISSFHDDSCSG